jgi:pantoate--beta-alanine ligase
MKVIKEIAKMKWLRQQLTEPVGLVPTMGYFHSGHLALVRRAGVENPNVIVSIFINPTQFGLGEDFHNYPCDPQHDLAMLEEEKVDIVFMPSVAEMYPPQFNSWVEVSKITERLEGATRPNHFKGVTTVVAKLFHVTQPSRAYFGQKDIQQVIVIKKMVDELNMNLETVTVPTIRESDGLAMSSRNTYLNHEERRAAVILYQALNLARKLWTQGEKNAENLRQQMKNLIEKQPLATIDYVSIADSETLDELVALSSPVLVSLAVRIGKTRLIDNVMLE